MAEELVLVIDNQAVMRELIVNRVLIPHGYRTAVAAEGHSGLQKAIELHPDLIILGMEVSQPSGVEILKALHERGRNIPAIAIAPERIESLTWQSICWGLREYICEPFKVEELLEAIDRALSEARLRKQIEQLQERMQRLAQQQKMLYVIAQAVTSPLGYQQVLNRLVEAAVYVTEATGSSLLLQDRESGQLYVRSVLEEGQPRAQMANQAVQDVLAQRTLDSGESLVLSGSDAQAAGSLAPALLQVPLKVQGRTIGVLRVVRSGDESSFEMSSVYMLSVLAGYAAIAIENSRLYVRIEGEVERTAVYRIGTAFGSTLQLDSVLDMAVSEALRLTGAERGYVAMMDEAGEVCTPQAMHGLDTATIDSAEFRLGRHIVSRVIEEGKPFRAATESKDWLKENEVQAVLCVPILGSSGVLGAIYVDCRDVHRHFTAHQLNVLTMLSVYAAAAIQNARLFNRVEAERRKLEAVIRGTDQPVVVADVGGTVLLMNAAARRALGTHRASGTGMLLPQVIEDGNLRVLFDEAKVGGQVRRGEIALPTGQTFSATVTPITGVGFVAVMQDVTHFKELARLKSEFVSTVSHDLRSPLSTVLGFLDVLDQLGPLNEQQKDFVASAQHEVRRLIDLTSDLLDLGYLETGIDMEMKQCNIQNIIQGVLEHWRKQINGHRHILQVELPEQPVFIYGNAMRLCQVIDNLISNAIKYTLPGGRILVHLARQDLQAILRVQDTGIGIAPEDQPYVFDRFFRVHSEQTKGVDGTGLGLAIAQSIVERHQGRIWLESEPGKGTTFYVSLPVVS